MKSEHLHDLWSSPDNSRLVSKQFSFRLPTHIAAKLAALGDIYPQKNRTQIVADLLSLALADLEKNLPYTVHEAPEDVQRHEYEISKHLGYPIETVYELGGTRSRFWELSNKYFKEYEKELGNENPQNLFTGFYGSKDYLENLNK